MTPPSFLLKHDVQEIIDHLPINALQRFAGKHVLITGGRGFLGRYFTAVLDHLNKTHLVGREVRVTCLDNFIASGAAGRDVSEFSGEHVRFIEHDVTKPVRLHYDGDRYEQSDTSQLVPRVDFILHAAGIASPAHYRAHPLETLEVATTGLKNSLELARANPGCRLVFFSSSEIYGDPDPKMVPTPETYRGNVACLGPRACYDESKRLGETLCQIYNQQYGVEAMIIRPFNVYGPGMQHTDYRVLPNFAARIAKGEPVEVYGSGEQTRTYCYVTDAIGGFLRVLLHGRGGEPYNIGNPSPEISVLELADRVKVELEKPGIGPLGWHDVNVHTMPHPPSYPADEPNRRCPDIAKATRELGYAPRVSIDEGLRRFFGWALESYPRRSRETIAPSEVGDAGDALGLR